MAKKVIKLNEQDIENLVKKIIKESHVDKLVVLTTDNFMKWVESFDYMKSSSIEGKFQFFRVKGGEYYENETDKILVDYFENFGINVSDEEKSSFKNTIVDTYQKGIPTLKESVKKIIKEEQLGGHTQDEMNDVWEKLNNTIGVNPKYDDLMDAAFGNEPSISIESFINQLPTRMGYEMDYLTSVLSQIEEEGI